MKKRLFKWRSLILTILFFFLSLKVALSFPVETLNLVEQGQKLYQTEQYQDAATVWQKVANTFARQGDGLNQAMALSNLSLSEQKLGQWKQAQENITKSLEILQSQQKTPEQKKILASTLDIQGQLQLAIGQPTNALETWQQATEIYQNLEDPNGITRSQINQAQAMQELGLYPRACETLLTALAIDHQGCEISAEKLQKFTDTATPTQILGLRSLGNVLRVVGQTEASQQVLFISGQLAQQIGDQQNLAAIYLSLGNTARAVANRGKQQKFEITESVDCFNSNTEHFYQQATACYRQAEAFPSTQMQAQLNLLSLYLQTGQFSEISSLLDQIQANLAALPPSQNSISAHLKLAQNLLCLKSDTSSQPLSPILQQCPAHQRPENIAPTGSEIEKIITIALQQAQRLENQQAIANALGYLGATYEQRGNVSKAEQLTEQALQNISAFESPHITYLWHWQLGHLYQKQGKITEAIKSYTLAFETLQSLRGDLVATNPDIQFTFRDSVEPLYRELVDLLLQSENPSQENLSLARNVIEALQLAELNNFFQEACLEAKPQSIEQLDTKAAIIYPIILPKRLAIILSLPKQPLRYYTTAFNKTGELEQTFDNLSANLNLFIASPEPLQPHQQFYDWLIRPTEAELKENNIKTLVFVLDGVLRNVPIAALHDGQQYLIENYNVVLTPGLQLIEPRSLALKNLKILAGGLSTARQGFPPLPGVEQEVKEIAKIASTEVLLDKEFTRERLKTEIEATSFPVVHLATHGQFSSQAENTFLLTWDERINVKDVNQVLQERGRQAKNPVELLILSACQTAVGDQRAALGLAGVAVRSGARSTVATLWSVQDQSTANLMTQFYLALNQPGVSKADALRHAQLSLLRSPQYQHPYYWAPFVLVGNWL